MEGKPPLDQRLARIRHLRQRAIVAATDVRDRPMDEAHPLARAIGLAEARAVLAAEPTPLQARWADRRAIVAKRIAEGVAIKQIARELNVTPTRIRQLRKALDL